MYMRIPSRIGFIIFAVVLMLLFVVITVQGATSDSLNAVGTKYFKSRFGLMLDAYGPNSIDLRRLAQRGSTSSNQFQPSTVYLNGSWPEAVANGEWTADNRFDALLSTSFDWDPANDQRLHLFSQTVSGILTRTQQIATGVNPMALARGDFNHDGRHDAAVINQSDNTLGVFTQYPTGTLSAMVTYFTGDSPDGLTVGDFNGDLRDDVAVSHAISQSIAVYYQQINGTYATPVYFGLSSGGYNDIAAGDLNGDGYDDLVVLRGAGHPNSQVAIFYQANHTFTAPVFLTAEDGGFLTHGLAVGDVTNDGRDDIVVTAGGNVSQAFVNVFAQQSDGTMAIMPVVYPAFHLPEAIRIGDVNHDGRNDVVGVHASWLSLSVYPQTLTGTLSAYESYPLPYRDYYHPDSLDLGDVNSDGGLDVLVANHSSLAAENGLVVLTNNTPAPTSTITTPAIGAFVTSTTTYRLQGTASAGTLEISTNGGRSWTSQSATASWSFAWTVPITDGNYIILTRVRDALGRVQSPYARTHLIVDHTAPTGTLLVNQNAAYTNIPTVTLSLTGDDFNGVNAMRFANQEAGYSLWLTFAPTYTWLLTGTDGLKTVTGQLQDVPGNVSTPFSDTIILDTTPPTCTAAINNGAALANSTEVTLNLTAADLNGVTHLRVRNAGGSWPAWQPYTITLPWSIPGGDGSRLVEVQTLDAADNLSAICSDSIVLDMTPPTCQITIADGMTYTNRSTVTLSLNSTDANGVSRMRFSNDGVTWANWQTYAVTNTWSLPNPDGFKTVRAQFEDNAGNPSATCQDDIIFDSTAPTGFVIVNGGALYTPVPTVTLTLGASDVYGVTSMRFSNDGTAWSGWQPYGVSATWALSNTDGLRTVYVQFQDDASNISAAVTDQIILDTTPPSGSVVINDNATYTPLPTVTLSITATDAIPVTQMRFSHDGLSWTDWEAYATSRTWLLTAGDGSKTVYVQFADSVGNVSQPLADSIILDTTAPSCQLYVAGGSVYITQTLATLNVACSDANPSIEVRYSNDGATWSNWSSYTAVANWSLSSGDGLKTVYLQARDIVGNLGGPFTDTITLDTTAPSCSIVINNGAAYATTLSAQLALTCSDTNGLDGIRFSDDGVAWRNWQSYVTSTSWIIPAGDGVKTIYLQSRDVPGNVTAPVTDTIVLDTILPSGGCTFIGNNGFINNTSAFLSLWAYDDNGVPEMQVRNTGHGWSEWISVTDPLPWTVPAGDGEKVVECHYRDAAANISPVYSTTAILDTQAPTCQIDINGGAAYVSAPLVTMIVSSTDNYAVDQMRFKETGNWSAWEAFGLSRSWTLTSGDGPKTVWGQMKDRAGNVQQCSDDVVLDTTSPTGTLTLADGAAYTSVPTVTVAITATEELSTISSMCLGYAGTNCTAWQPYQSNSQWVLNQIEGTPQTLCVWLRDGASNSSEAVCDSTALDTAAPNGSLLINNGSESTTQRNVMLQLAASDAHSGVCDMQIRNASETWSAWLAYSTPISWTLPAHPGTNQVEARFRDCVGNVSEVVYDTIMLKTQLFLPLVVR